MAGFVDTEVKVEAITQDKICVRIGPEGFEWERAELEELAQGRDASQMLKLNIAIAMALAGTKFDNAAQIKNAIEARSFKYWR